MGIDVVGMEAAEVVVDRLVGVEGGFLAIHGMYRSTLLPPFSLRFLGPKIMGSV